LVRRSLCRTFEPCQGGRGAMTATKGGTTKQASRPAKKTAAKPTAKKTVAKKTAEKPAAKKTTSKSSTEPYCFPPWVQVAIVGGAERPISEVHTGDLVCSWDRGRGVIAQGRVERVIIGTTRQLIRVNDRLAASPDHRILTVRGYVPFAALVVGDRLISGPGQSEEVLAIKVLNSETLVYNLIVSPHASFIVEGVLVEDYEGETLPLYEGLTTGAAGSARNAQELTRADPVTCMHI
jgi:hypothetical protein